MRILTTCFKVGNFEKCNSMQHNHCENSCIISYLARLHITSVLTHAPRICTRLRVIGVDDLGANHPDFAIVTYIVGGEEDGGTMMATTRAVRARMVLVTVSLGVLKSGTIDFVPPLPGEKLVAIKAMG